MSDMTERNCNECIHHTSGNCDSWDCNMQTVEDVKNESVNEYVKVVVEELEKELEKGNIAIDLGEFRLFEIVKQGGVADDVCEWNYDAYGRWHTECHTLADNDPLEYTYCPYCGKKIKVVE